MASLREQVGQRVRELRKARKLTQKELADRIGMDYRYAGAIEREEVNLTLDSMGRLGTGLNVEPFQLLLTGLEGQLASQGEMLESELEKFLKTADEDLLKAVIEVVRVMRGLRD